jgi:hypothetical protein
MYNSHSRYQQDYQEAMAEDTEGTLKFLQKEREKALKSYNSNNDIIYCSICGEPLVKNSISYEEGYHTDNCI